MRDYNKTAISAVFVVSLIFGELNKMSEKKAIEQIIEAVVNHVESSFSGVYEIYNVSFKPVNRQMVLEVIIDSPEGIKVEDCETVSRSLSEYLDETDIIHRTYTLEVSSPGVERMMKRKVDYERHIGRLIKWTLISPEEGLKKEVFRARLQEFSEENIVVSHNKKLRSFPLSRVEKARAILEFPKKEQAGLRRGGKKSG